MSRLRSFMTPVTPKLTTAQCRIRSELGNYPSGPTKFTVIHRRPIFSLPPSEKFAQQILANSMCRYPNHLPATGRNKAPPDRKSKIKNEQTPPPIKEAKLIPKARIKRSLSADSLNNFQPVPAKRPFPVQIWFNHPKVPRLPVATAYWLDSPLHDSMTFVYTKLLEASQASRYLQLQSKPRKYLHMTGGGIHSINTPPIRKPEIILPAMTVQFFKPAAKPVLSIPKKPIPSKLPPPPGLISLRPDLRSLNIRTPPQQEEPLELCKKRNPPPTTPVAARPVSPLNLVTKSSIMRRASIPPIVIQKASLPVDLASPSPTSAFNKMNLSTPKSPNDIDKFRTRLVALLQVIFGQKKLQILGHPQVIVDEVLARILEEKGIPAKSSEVRQNWLKLLRLCFKSEDAWIRDGWDVKTPDAILDEIYIQDVIPKLKERISSSSVTDKRRPIPEETDIKPRLNRLIGK